MNERLQALPFLRDCSASGVLWGLWPPRPCLDRVVRASKASFQGQLGVGRAAKTPFQSQLGVVRAPKTPFQGRLGTVWSLRTAIFLRMANVS